ncbi:hypothetical protein A2U01_0094861, partial [Trifolium medium]|nr:hypothetical protein [Trifolium medium]
AAEMLGIDPEVACHQLTIDPRANVVVQRRRKPLFAGGKGC